MDDPNGWGDTAPGVHRASLRDAAGGEPPWSHRHPAPVPVREDGEPPDALVQLAEERHWDRYA